MEKLEYIRYEVSGRLATLTLNRPEEDNTLHYSFIAELKWALAQAEQDGQVKALLLKAEGPSFCKGVDPRYIFLLQGKGEDAPEILQDMAYSADLLVQMSKFRKPLFAAVNGPALGLGCALLLVCDFVIATPQAEFGFPDVRMGMIPGIEMPFLLRRVNATDARALILSGEAVGAEEARKMGLVFRVVEGDKLEDEVKQTTERLLTQAAPGAQELCKRILNDIQEMPLQNALAFTAKMGARARDAHEARKAIAAKLAGEAIERWD